MIKKLRLFFIYLFCLTLLAYSDSIWMRKADMPTERGYAAVGTVNGKIYLLGGYSNNTPVRNVEEYDPIEDTWTKKADMPTARYMCAAGVVNGRIYVIGGTGSSADINLSTVEEYDPKTDKWTTKTSMPTRRHGHTIGVVNNKIYAIGGWNEIANSWLTTVQEYDPRTDKWTTKTSMPTARRWLAAGVVNGKIYAIGGSDNIYHRTVEEYDTATNLWTKKSDMPTGRCNLAIAVVNNKIYAIGGNNISSLSTVEEYDPAKNTWEQKTAILTPRGGLMTAAVHNKIYAIGGSDVASLSVVEVADVKNLKSENLSLSAKIERPIIRNKDIVNIAVADFIGKNVSQADASITADFFRTELVQTGMFNVIEKASMDKILSEAAFQQSGCTTTERAVQIGKILNVQQMVVGSLSKLMDTYFITTNLVDVETGKILVSYDQKVITAQEIKDACKVLSQKLVQ
ncbi:MAG: kelch repeat-containing protein [Elusimicrobiota bacterium]|nr:kelch repeat-containing protein [Elusimicrobiota bacterium]